jgi:hypothetical protein
MYGEIHADQLLMPYDSTALHVLGRPEPVADSLVARVKYLYEDPILPSIQNYLAIDLTARDGIRIGDEFMLYDPRHKTDDAPDGLVDPDISIARAQVVRVTQYGTTLMIISQEHPKIDVGTMARRVAMMP